MSSKNTFHLGITMAGAVSAGAYTAGFIDYLIEILELWEAQKQIIREKLAKGEELTAYEKKIPLHDVCIEALGGASAGGMVGVITALSTFSKMPPVKEPTNTKTGNILYDGWVLLDDDKVKTFEKMLDIDDIAENDNRAPSLLNSKPIDRIVDNVLKDLVEKKDKIARPNYISEDLRVLLTLCSLRGIPYELKFNHLTSANFPYSPGHRMNEHMIIAHFKLNFDDKTDKDVYLKFDPYDATSLELIKLCTKGTGAFPIGLAPRHFKCKISKEYIKNSILRNLDIPKHQEDIIDIKIDSTNFDFTNVDGGTINNEPYSEVVQVLEQKVTKYNPELPMFGTIMVDPFPNFYNQDEAKPVKNIFTKFLFQNNILDIIPKLYTTFREQVRVKHSGSFYKDYLRLLVFPVKWEENEILKNHPPLSCAALGGFGGFLDIEFRKHDFFLGRNNARNFLRAFFMLEYDEENLHPLFKDLSKEALNEFKRTPRKNNPLKKRYVPIIPDLNFIQDKIEKRKDNTSRKTSPYYYTVNEFPKLDKNYFKNIKPKFKHRVKAILKAEINNFKGKWYVKLGLKVTRWFVVLRIVNSVIKVMKKDFANRNMIAE